MVKNVYKAYLGTNEEINNLLTSLQCQRAEISSRIHLLKDVLRRRNNGTPPITPPIIEKEIIENDEDENDEVQEILNIVLKNEPKKRGRKPKNKNEENKDDKMDIEKPKKRGRGRPKKELKMN